MSDMTPEQLDEWPWEKALAAGSAQAVNRSPMAVWFDHKITDEYRRLVIEDVRPPAEPDQDTLDARAVLGAWHDDCMPHEPTIASDLRDGLWDGDDSFRAAFHALATIKARVRREAIQELPDQPSDEAVLLADKSAMGTFTHTMEGKRKIAACFMAAIKQVYGKDT